MKKNAYTTKETGNLGERLACEYLGTQGYIIMERNYWKKYGEIDIIAKKDGIIHFIEVKTVSYETKQALEYAVSHETWRPEEQVTDRKLHQIEKALETWISERQYEGEWQIDVAAVRIVPREIYAAVNYIANIIQ